jgi:ribokinase
LVDRFQVPRLLICGAINWDTTLFVEKLPGPGEEVRVERILSVPGGKGANAAVAASRILGKKVVGLLGMLGNDVIADRQLAVLGEEGVDTACVSCTNNILSGQAYVAVDSKGENMILTHRAANRAMTLDFVHGATVSAAIDSASMIMIIDPPLDIATELAKQAKIRDKTLVFSPATLVSHGLSALESILNSTDYLILNEHEAKSLAGAKSGPSACDSLAAKLRNRRVIITLGGSGCLTSCKGENAQVPAMDVSVFGMKVMSTVGAGDTFEGAFASFKLMGRCDLEAIFLANIAAGIKITKEQTRGSPGYEEILKFADSDPLRSAYNSFRSS